MARRRLVTLLVFLFSGYFFCASALALEDEKALPAAVPGALPSLLDEHGRQFDRELSMLSQRAHAAALEARAERLGSAAGVADTSQSPPVRLDYGLLEAAQADAQAIGGTADEPTGQALLPVDPTLSCPGFYVLRTHAGQPSQSGRFGAELLLRGTGRRTLQGGLNFGGRASTAVRGFSAFSIANPRNEPQVVDVGVSVFAPGQLILERRSAADGNTIYIDQNIAPGETKVSATVVPGFYVVSFQPSNSASTAYGVSALTSFVDRPGGGFQGGVVVGGLHDPDRAHPTTQSTGWASFCIAEPFDVEVSVLSRPTYGSSGATGMGFSLSTGDGLVFLDSRNPAAQITNILRGGPDDTNPMAIPVQITGVNAPPWSSDLGQWLGAWQAPQAIYDQGAYINHPDFWSNVGGDSFTGSSWENLDPGQSYGILVADLQQVRPIQKVSVFQMFGLGKITHIALAAHPHSGATPPDAFDFGWVPFLAASPVGPGIDHGTYIREPTQYTVDASTRYVKIMAYNDGSLGDIDYIDLKGIKMYSPAPDFCAYSLSAANQSHGSCTADGAVQIITQAGCPWSVTTSGNWLTVTGGHFGTGSGTVTYALTANNTSGPRQGTIVIGDQTLVVSQAVSACPFPQHTPEIVITSERSFIFEQAGESALLQAEVLRRCDACPVPELPISFYSSNTSVVSVDSSGVLTAQTSTPSSASIEVRAHSVPSQMASAVIAVYAPETVFIPLHFIIDFNPQTGIVRLDRNAITESLQPGDILISNEIGGLLNRVLSVSIQDGVVVLETEPASLVDAFLELEVSIIGPTWEYESVLDDDVMRVLNAYGEVVQRMPFGLKCKRENGEPIDVTFTLPSLTQRLSLTPIVDYKIARTGTFSRRVDFFDLNVLGEIGVDISTGSVELAASVSTKVTCERKAEQPFILAFIPIAGPVGIGPTVTPAAGFEIEGKATAGKLNFTGPKFSQGLESTMGLAYAHGAGFRPISDYRVTGDGLQWPSYDSDLNLEFQVKVEPFVKVTTNMSGLVGRWSIYDFDFAEAKAYGGTELKIKGPFDWRQFEYMGPEWRFYWGVYGGLDPLFEKLNVFERFLTRLGVSASVTGISPTLFNPEWPLATSPKPEVEVKPNQASVGDEINLTVKSVPSADVDFLAYTRKEDGTHAAGVDIASVKTGNNGQASTKWTPTSSNDGRHDIRAMAFKWPFGDIGFPYGSKNAGSVDIGSDVQLQIDPVELTDGRIAQKYDFELVATEIPGSMESVEFEWNFGVGSPGNRSVPVDSGVARTIISQVYDEAGTYTLSVRVRHGSDTLATATANIQIEGVILDISPPGLSEGEANVEYEFEFTATGLSDDMGEVVFNWSFGVGSVGTGARSVPVSSGQATMSESHTYIQQGGYGLYVDVSHGGTILAQRTVSVVIGRVDETEEELNICDQWSARKLGRQGVTVNNWDISDIPEGSVFDIRFNAYSIPDKFVVDYEGSVVLDTGWRGATWSYNQNPSLYPGGLSGPGSGSVFDIFRKRDANNFRVTVYGPQSGTEWEYNIRCRAACDVTLDPTRRTHSAQQEQGSISVLAESDCEWTASTSASWIQVGATGSGDGTVNYTVQENTTGLERSGVIRVGGTSFLVTQTASECDYTIMPTSRDHGGGTETGTVSVSADSNCSWAATSNNGWISITSGNAGSGDGTVAYSVAANTGSAARTGTLTIANQTFTVNQAACESSISPTSRAHGPEQETGTVNVTAETGCEWTSTSDSGWLSITSGSSGSGDGVVGYSVAANPDPDQRSGTLTIAGHTFTVTQQGGQCVYNISPTSRSHGPGGENGTVWVTTDPGCDWTASSNSDWITIQRGATGTGEDTVRYFVPANTGASQRTGTMTIAGQTFTVTQSAVTTTSSITGRILQQGEPERDVEVSLWRVSSGQWTNLDLVKSASDGYFAFVSVTGLGAGQSYVVVFSNGEGANTPPDINRLSYWRTYAIDTFASGSSIVLLPFEIGNIALQDPVPGATVTLPKTFTWTPRSHQAPAYDGGMSDDYDFNLYEDDNNWWYSDLLGDSGSFSLDTLPSGFVTGRQYRWFIYVWGDDGFGASWNQGITFQ